MIAVACTASICKASSGASIVIPTFSAPLLIQSRMVFVAEDGRRIICLDHNGHLVWQANTSSTAVLARGDASQLLAQYGGQIYQVDIDTGKQTNLFGQRLRNLELCWNSRTKLVIGRDSRAEDHWTWIINPQTGSYLCKHRGLQNVLATSSGLLLCLLETERRELGEKEGRTKIIERVTGLRQPDCSIAWEIQLSPHLSETVPALDLDQYLVVLDGDKRILAIQKASGKIVGTINHQWSRTESFYHERIIDIAALEGRPAYLTRHVDPEDTNSMYHLIHICSLPSLNEEKTLRVNAIGISSFCLAGNVIIAQAGGWTMAIDPQTGRVLWRKAHMHWSDTRDGKVYFGQFIKTGDKFYNAIKSADLTSGEEQQLYQEPWSSPTTAPASSRPVQKLSPENRE